MAAVNEKAARTFAFLLDSGRLGFRAADCSPSAAARISSIAAPPWARANGRAQEVDAMRDFRMRPATRVISKRVSLSERAA